MPANIQLSVNFFLSEFLTSQSAVRLAFTEQFNPPESVVENLRQLCTHVLQPLRNAIGVPLRISSGYRCQQLNSHVGGAGKSQHLTGQAADIQCPALGNEELLRRIVALELPFDQLINEFGYQWVHVSYDPTRGRAMVLEAVKGQSGATEYKPMTV